jgi:hypothetical protein
MSSGSKTKGQSLRLLHTSAGLFSMERITRHHLSSGHTVVWGGSFIQSRSTAMLEAILSDPAMKDVNFDISWDEVAKYIVSTPESLRVSADMINRYPDRFLFGTDEVAPANQEKYLRVHYQYEPLWKARSAEASAKVRKRNYERLFNEGRRKVRAWEGGQCERTLFTLTRNPPADLFPRSSLDRVPSNPSSTKPSVAAPQTVPGTR